MSVSLVKTAKYWLVVYTQDGGKAPLLDEVTDSYEAAKLRLLSWLCETSESSEDVVWYRLEWIQVDSPDAHEPCATYKLTIMTHPSVYQSYDREDVNIWTVQIAPF